MRRTFARIRNLVDGVDRSVDGALDTAVDRLAGATPEAGERGLLHLNVGAPDQGSGRRVKVLFLQGRDDGSGKTVRPDVEIICSEETLWRMLDGSYSPVEAFRDGQMRLRGDEQRAKRVLRYLAGPDGSVDCT